MKTNLTKQTRFLVRSKKVIIACATTAAIGLYVAATQAATLSDFDSFSNGTINGQSGWTVADSWGNSANMFDQAVVDLGGGNKVWRMSNGQTTNGFSNHPFSPSAPAIAGETGAVLLNNFGPNHTTPYSPPQSSGTASTNLFYGAWDFKSATGAAQPDLALTVSASAKQSTLRMTYLRMIDNGSTGFDLTFIGTGPGGSFPSATTIASGLSYTDWHHVEMGIQFVDGLGLSVSGNDVVTIKLDGSVIHTGTTWESYYASFNDAGSTSDKRAVNSLLFRSAGTAATGTLGSGFYFDNVEVSNRAIPEPGSLTLAGMAVAGFGCYLRRRRRR